VLVLLQDDVRLSKVFNGSGVGSHVNCLFKPRRQFEDELKSLDQSRHSATTASHAKHINNHTRIPNTHDKAIVRVQSGGVWGVNVTKVRYSSLHAAYPTSFSTLALLGASLSCHSEHSVTIRE